MKRAIQLSLLSTLLLAVMTVAPVAAPLLMFQINSVDTTADTLLNHAVLAEGHFSASPVPLAAGLYEFDVAVFDSPEGGKELWTSVEPLEIQPGGILHATIFNIPGRVFFDTTGGLHMVTRYLQLGLPSLDKTFSRVPIESKKNALAATRVFQYRLFEQWADHPTTALPPAIREKILEFIANRQNDEIVHMLVEKYIDQSERIEELQNRLYKLEGVGGKK